MRPTGAVREEPEEGGRVFEVKRAGQALELRFGNGAIHANRIRRGDLVWRTHDPEIDKAARPYLEPAAPLRKQPVRVRAVAREGEPLVTEWSVGAVSVTVRSEMPLGPARNRALDEEFLAATVRPPGQHALRTGRHRAGDRRRAVRPQRDAEPDPPRRRRAAARAPRQ